MLFKAEFSEAITPIFSVTCAFRNHYYKIKQNKKSGHQIKLYSKKKKIISLTFSVQLSALRLLMFSVNGP